MTFRGAMPAGSSPRKCSILLKNELSADKLQRISSLLQLQESIEVVRLESQELLILYRFPDVSIGSILTQVFEIADISTCKTANRTANKIRVFMENNEKDYQALTCGWHRYIENIYLHYFEKGLDDRTDNRKQSWRIYK